jgi:hypothetical protein
MREGTGSVRQYWSVQALAEADARLVEIEKYSEGMVMRACEKIIKALSDAEQCVATDRREDAPPVER